MDKAERVVCPNCGSRNIEALIRRTATAYATHAIRGIRDGKLLLRSKPTQHWVEGDFSDDQETDEELKCRDCGECPDINDLSLGQEDFEFVAPRKSKAITVAAWQ